MTKKLWLAAAFGLALAACTPDAADTPATTEAPPAAAPVTPPTEAEAAAIVDADFAKLAAGDAAAIAAGYAAGAIVLMPDANDAGAPNNEGLAKWLADEKPKATLNTRNIQVLDADTFIASGLATFDVTRNGKPTWFVLRYSEVFQKQPDGSWLVAHEHLSNPPQIVKSRLPALEGSAPVSQEAEEAPPLGGSAPKSGN